MDESGLGVGIAGGFGWEKLEGDRAVQLGVDRLVDHPHAPSAELAGDLVVRNGLADHAALPSDAGEKSGDGRNPPVLTTLFHLGVSGKRVEVKQMGGW